MTSSRRFFVGAVRATMSTAHARDDVHGPHGVQTCFARRAAARRPRDGQAELLLGIGRLRGRMLQRAASPAHEAQGAAGEPCGSSAA